MEFTDEEVVALHDIVSSWICEGFTIPPYTDAQYGIFEKLGLDRNGHGVASYDTRRPSTTP